MNKDFTYYRIDISDEDDNFILNTKIWEHDTVQNNIEVQPSPFLLNGMWCRVLLRTFPVPTVYKGRIKIIKGSTIIELSCVNDEKEVRQAPRYEIDKKVTIEGLVYDDNIYPLHTNIEAFVENIGRGGMKIKTAKGTFYDNDRLLVRIKATKGTPNGSLLLMEVVKNDDLPENMAAYNCKFILESNVKPILDKIERELNLENAYLMEDLV